MLFSLKVLSLPRVVTQWQAYMGAQHPVSSHLAVSVSLVVLVSHAINPRNIGVDKISAPPSWWPWAWATETGRGGGGMGGGTRNRPYHTKVRKSCKQTRFTSLVINSPSPSILYLGCLWDPPSIIYSINMIWTWPNKSILKVGPNEKWEGLQRW
jgi:hypothetical protein